MITYRKKDIRKSLKITGITVVVPKINLKKLHFTKLHLLIIVSEYIYMTDVINYSVCFVLYFEMVINRQFVK